MTASTRLSVRVTPRSSRTALEGWTADGTLRVRVTSAPVDGKANTAVIAVIAKALDIAPSRITLLSGTSSRTKILGIEAMSIGEVREKLE